MTRKSEFKRKTKETDISVDLELMSLKEARINSGVPFFDHMLASFARHGRLFIDLQCRGDNDIDDHHTVEDIGICLGTAFQKALGDKAGITRFGDAVVPMDDALTMVAVDLSGRPYFSHRGIELKGYINRFSEELTLEFLRSFAGNAGINLHINVLYGENRHHIHESIFKAMGVALYKAVSLDPFLAGSVLSTKGTI
ncbi:MAG: imidazoleglycerol-phosphate dehydratase HisB [Spirochaetae bacterium HGW-Spirochaetae-1]|jgi:imidazoleglycerol-phosphate dehydratase|nr:MAG: imidazoleglycerol-phosphate dehydratase HisB [Spirochaetae bacterium HGW-Spirochaetae-1]